MADYSFPQIAYDFDKYVHDNMTPRGCFKDGSIFKEIGALSIERGSSIIHRMESSMYKGAKDPSLYKGKVYSYTITLLKCVVKNTPKRQKKDNFYLDIVISQSGVSVIDFAPPFSFDEIHAIVSKLEDELDAYRFVPAAYELWPDFPDEPYYIPAGQKPLCDTVVVKEEGPQCVTT